METIVKQAREVGTSAGVLLPRKWLNKQVVVTLFLPDKAEIAKDVLDFLFTKNLNEEVKGIYIFGSYSRGDYDRGSDIDILVITSEINKFITYKNYEIFLCSEESLSKNFLTNLYYASMLNEIDVIVNKELIEKYIQNKKSFNPKKTLGEIRGVLKMNKDFVNFCTDYDEKVLDGVVYSLVLRLRELYLIKCLALKKTYFKSDFFKICGEKNYATYIRVKREEKEVNDTFPQEVKNLIDLSEKWLKELKEQKRV